MDAADRAPAGDRRQRHARAAPAQPALLERLDAAGILVWQGVAPFDVPGRWAARTRATRELTRSAACGSTCSTPARTRACSPGTSSTRSRQRRPRTGSATYVVRAARLARRLDPRPARRRRRLGHAPAARRRARSTARSTPSAAPTTRAGTRTSAARRAVVDARIRRLARAAARTVPGQGAGRHRVRRRGRPAQPARAPGGLDFQARPARPPHPRLPGRPAPQPA